MKTTEAPYLGNVAPLVEAAMREDSFLATAMPEWIEKSTPRHSPEQLDALVALIRDNNTFKPCPSDEEMMSREATP